MDVIWHTFAILPYPVTTTADQLLVAACSSPVAKLRYQPATTGSHILATYIFEREQWETEATVDLES